MKEKENITMSIYDTLNEQQREAVYQTEGPVLILAGAGSGKTRVLTHRTAYLIEEKGVNPYHIMAITFTNKAAGEMRERIDKIVGFGSESIWLSTFHSSCVRILRRHIDRIGFDTNFTIYDADDSKSLMKDICKRLEIDTKIYKEKSFFSSTQISSLTPSILSSKDLMLNPHIQVILISSPYSCLSASSIESDIITSPIAANLTIKIFIIISQKYSISKFSTPI